MAKIINNVGIPPAYLRNQARDFALVRFSSLYENNLSYHARFSIFCDYQSINQLNESFDEQTITHRFSINLCFMF